MDTAKNDILLQVEGLHVQFDGHQVLKGVKRVGGNRVLGK